MKNLIIILSLLASIASFAGDKAGNGQLLVKVTNEDGTKSIVPFEAALAYNTRTYLGLKRLPDGQRTNEPTALFDRPYKKYLLEWINFIKTYDPALASALENEGNKRDFIYTSTTINFPLEAYPEDEFPIQFAEKLEAAIFYNDKIYISIPTMDMIDDFNGLSKEQLHGFVLLHELINAAYKGKLAPSTSDNDQSLTDTLKRLQLGQLILETKIRRLPKDEFFIRLSEIGLNNHWKTSLKIQEIEDLLIFIREIGRESDNRTFNIEKDYFKTLIAHAELLSTPDEFNLNEYVKNINVFLDLTLVELFARTRFRDQGDNNRYELVNKINLNHPVLLEGFNSGKLSYSNNIGFYYLNNYHVQVTAKYSGELKLTQNILNDDQFHQNVIMTLAKIHNNIYEKYITDACTRENLDFMSRINELLLNYEKKSNDSDKVERWENTRTAIDPTTGLATAVSNVFSKRFIKVKSCVLQNEENEIKNKVSTYAKKVLEEKLLPYMNDPNSTIENGFAHMISTITFNYYFSNYTWDLIVPDRYNKSWVKEEDRLLVVKELGDKLEEKIQDLCVQNTTQKCNLTPFRVLEKGQTTDQINFLEPMDPKNLNLDTRRSYTMAIQHEGKWHRFLVAKIPTSYSDSIEQKGLTYLDYKFRTKLPFKKKESYSVLFTKVGHNYFLKPKVLILK